MKANLTRRELAANIAGPAKLTHAQAMKAVDLMLENMVDAMVNDRPIELRRFGSFVVKSTKPRVVRNPRLPGSDFTMPGRRVVRFRMSRSLESSLQPLGEPVTV